MSLTKNRREGKWATEVEQTQQRAERLTERLRPMGVDSEAIGRG